jgi:hypothetical protein
MTSESLQAGSGTTILNRSLSPFHAFIIKNLNILIKEQKACFVNTSFWDGVTI